MSLFRRNIITISRVPLPTTGGSLNPNYFDGKDVPVFTGIKADIQYKAMTSQSTAKLPLDTDQGIDTVVFFKLPKGSVLQRDFITDELGIRYQVFHPYYTLFGYQCYCKKEQM